jgi:hypothetical protein
VVVVDAVVAAVLEVLELALLFLLRLEQHTRLLLVLVVLEQHFQLPVVHQMLHQETILYLAPLPLRVAVVEPITTE